MSTVHTGHTASLHFLFTPRHVCWRSALSSLCSSSCVISLNIASAQQWKALYVAAYSSYWALLLTAGSFCKLKGTFQLSVLHNDVFTQAYKTIHRTQ